MVVVVTAAAIVWMLAFFARSAARHPVLPAAFGLVIGGSLSNLFDRMWLGHVTDFIDVNWWTFRIFNLADSFIVVGVVILLVALVARRPRTAAAAPHARRRRSVNVPATAAGTRLDKFLAEALGSRAAAERAVAAGALVDGVARPKSHRLEGGEVVTLADEPELVLTQHKLPEVPIAYEDEHVLVVDKPAGLVVHSGAGHSGDTLVDALAGQARRR